MSTTTRFLITLLEQAQASKEITINEALWFIAVLANGQIKDRHLTDAPGSESDGDLYYIAGAPADPGDWVGERYNLALYLAGIWYFFPVKEGMRFWVEDENAFLICTVEGSPPTWGTVTVT